MLKIYKEVVKLALQIDQILKGLDELFVAHRITEVEPYLLSYLEKARESGDASSEITLLNELIGFYRDTSQYEKSISACGQVLEIMENQGLKDTIPYATTLINVANAMRAAGKLEDSKRYYDEVFLLYDGKLDSNDFRYASLNNNMSLLYQEMNDFENACNCLNNALVIAKQYDEARIEVATTHTNLAMSLLKLDKVEEAKEHLSEALAIFEADEEKDFHYSAALAAMAEAEFLMGNLEESAAYYRKALQEIEKNVGRTQAYEIVEQNLNTVLDQIRKKELPKTNQYFSNGMELCEAFYEEYGAPMIHEKFPEYEHLIAVGLVGQGSECFGFDDELSKDHDFGPGFCMWLTDSAYDEIGVGLQKEYDKLPKTYGGVSRIDMPQSGKRVGVFRIKDFYEGLIGTPDVPESQNQWLFVEDYQLATATNGKVFRDDLGEFTRIRKRLLAYYPEEVRLKKIAREAALIAQSGQYNYFRTLKRQEYVAASLALAEFTKHTMSMVYLLNCRYAPFYKWMHRGMKELPILHRVSVYLEELVRLPVGHEMIAPLIDKIVDLILEQLKIQGLTKGQDTYLEHHTANILRSLTDKEKETLDSYSKEELVDTIVKMEWNAFDKVKNEGGRAGCQDDWGTFSIMRKSQFLTWPKELIASYIADFYEANEKGWNLITEKYGRMMSSTAPDEYEKIKDNFPDVSAKKAVIVEEIVKIQVGWMEEFGKQYPKACFNMRSIHTWEDSAYNTSYETYLRGELLTYSDETLRMYGDFIVSLMQSGKNLARLTVENTAKLYGYKSLEDMEARL